MYLSITNRKHFLCRKMACGAIAHRKQVVWNGLTIPFYPCRVEWNEIPFHFTPVGQFGMGVKWHVTPAHTQKGPAPRSFPKLAGSAIRQLYKSNNLSYIEKKKLVQNGSAQLENQSNYLLRNFSFRSGFFFATSQKAQVNFRSGSLLVQFG